MDDTTARIKQLIAEKLLVDIDEVHPDADLKEDLDADSLDIVELAMALDAEFDIEIPDEEVEDWDTVKDIIDYINDCG